MDYDIIIVVLILITSTFLLVKRIINDYKKAQIKKKRFYKEEGFFSRIYEIRFVYGCLISLIIGCIIYIYYRLSGKLENIFSGMLSYYGQCNYQKASTHIELSQSLFLHKCKVPLTLSSPDFNKTFYVKAIEKTSSVIIGVEKQVGMNSNCVVNCSVKVK